MIRPEQLSQTADEMLHGLTAPANGAAQARAKVNQSSSATYRMRRAVPALCCCAMLVAAVCVFRPWNRPGALQKSETTENVMMDLSEVEEAPAMMAAVTMPENVEKEADTAPETAIISFTADAASGGASVQPAMLDLELEGASVISSGNHEKNASDLWLSYSDGLFPMIRLNDGYYCQMTGDVPSASIGKKAGSVEVFTTDPVLDSSSAVMSNSVPSGTEINFIRNMNGTMLAAKVDGHYRCFQRVSFNGHALLKGEKLTDVLNCAGHVVSIHLNGMGTVSDSADVDRLIGILLKKSTRENNNLLHDGSILHMKLDNGLTLQLIVKKDRFSSCGTWSCPEFFEAFRDAVR